MKKNNIKYLKTLLVLVLALGCTYGSFAQVYNVKGRVSNYNTGLPIENVAVKYKNSSYGTTTDQNGEFKIRIPNKNDSLVFSAVNLVKQSFYIKDDSVNLTLNVILQPKITVIQPITLSENIERVIKEKQFRIRDYEVFDQDKLLVIGYKNRFAEKSLMLINAFGDTIDNKFLTGKADSLYKDFTGSYYLISGDSVYSLKERDKILFRANTNLSTKTFQNSVMKCLGAYYNKYFFSRYLLRGQQIELYYYDEVKDGMVDFLTIADSAGLDFVADLPEYRRYWARVVANTPGIPRFRRNFENVVRFDMMVSFHQIYSPILIFDGKLLVFDHENGYILYYNHELELAKQVPISYHLYEDWGEKIYFDEGEKKLYTSYIKNGYTTFKEINLETGGFVRTIEISDYDYIEKPTFSNGTLFFMYDEDIDPVKNLFRMRL